MMVKGYRRPRALPASAAISVVALVAAACGSGRPTVERHLVFVRATTPENAVIRIADADGSNRRRLAGGLSAVVSPDGRTIATGRPDGIHLISSDGKRDRHLTAAVLNPRAWSPDGQRLVAGIAKLALVEADSGRLRVLARGAFFGLGFAPDGRRLVYARAPRESTAGYCGSLGSRFDRYVVDLDHGSPTRLTHDGRSAYPVWGSSGIAFMRMPKRHSLDDCLAPGIWRVQADGSDLRPIIARAPTTLSHDGHYGLQPLAWLNSNTLLAGVRDEWGNEGAVVDVQSGRLRRLLRYSIKQGQRITRLFYVDKASRDGRLALGAGGDEKATISIIRVSDAHPLFTLRGYVCCPDWNR